VINIGDCICSPLTFVAEYNIETMGIVIGIDVGGSTTKIVGINGEQISILYSATKVQIVLLQTCIQFFLLRTSI